MWFARGAGGGKVVSFVFKPRAWVGLMVLEDESCPVHPTMKRPNCR